LELPKSHPPLVSSLSLHAEGMILNFSIPVLSCIGHSSFFYLLKGDGIAQVASFTIQSSLFYLWKEMELPKSLPPLFKCSVLFILPDEGDEIALRCSVLFILHAEGDGPAQVQSSTVQFPYFYWQLTEQLEDGIA
jgi:hypothetical protein